ncbi:hypothetical protein DTO96_102407 [Ephemeroptericola cinctiostellae]|uniref:Antirepressor protein ant N-terminal domain-containing protein n=1 Tax=Ephemeroptericola cinctiostellae TaxID=2268024 RepID=A0A345DE64_9BURK|nr:phage antirepressor N-terminal domain-containing protein [Ephemeroptericola cinctiostellae]AXF86652.1 hypothetical protein DTO96_102407 [Ephemeroptericola cinctiostellae]
MNAQSQLLPIQFAGATLYIINQNDQPFVPMRPVVEGMGLDWKSQFDKLKQRFATSVVEITTQMSGDNQRRQFVCLPLAKLAGWLYSISPNKVKPELRDKVMQYQNECDQVLFDYWTKGLAVRPLATGDGAGEFTPRFDPWFALVSDWLASDECAKVSVFHMSDILQGALHYKPTHEPQHWQMVRVGNIMSKLGFVKRRESTGAHRRWYYERGERGQAHDVAGVDALSVPEGGFDVAVMARAHQALIEATWNKGGVNVDWDSIIPTEQATMGLLAAVLCDNRWVLSFDRSMRPRLEPIGRDEQLISSANLSNRVSTGALHLSVNQLVETMHACVAKIGCRVGRVGGDASSQ